MKALLLAQETSVSGFRLMQIVSIQAKLTEKPNMLNIIKLGFFPKVSFS